MQPVIEKPALPTEIRGLVMQLQAVLQQYGYRINRSLPIEELPEHADDAAAATAGLALYEFYRTGSLVKQRVT